MASTGASDECFACEINEYSLSGSATCSTCRPGHYYREPPTSETEPCFTATLWDEYGDGWDDNVLQITAEYMAAPLYSLSYPKPSPYYPGAASITASVCLPAGQQFTAHIPEGPRHWQMAWSISSADLNLAESIRVTDPANPLMKDVTFRVPGVDTEALCLPCPEATYEARAMHRTTARLLLTRFPRAQVLGHRRLVAVRVRTVHRRRHVRPHRLRFLRYRKSRPQGQRSKNCGGGVPVRYVQHRRYRHLRLLRHGLQQPRVLRLRVLRAGQVQGGEGGLCWVLRLRAWQVLGDRRQLRGRLPQLCPWHVLGHRLGLLRDGRCWQPDQ
jgi:hypothetical protein